MTPLTAFLLGFAAASLVIFAFTALIYHRTERRLSHAERLLFALEQARERAVVACLRGSNEEFDLAEAEFWALSAELTHAKRDL